MKLLRKIRKNPQAMAGLILIFLLVLIALLAPVLAPHDPEEQNLLMKYQAPCAAFPLGTDQLGRCELSRLLYGTRYSLGVSLPLVAFLAVFGLIFGCLTACAPTAVRRVIRYLCDVLIAFPAVVLAAALTGAFGTGMGTLAAAIILSTSAWFVLMAQGYARAEFGCDYPLASRIAGCGTWGLIFRHLIPNIFPQYLVYISMGVASTIINLSGFAYLGIGFTTGVPEWGAMMNEARRGLYSHPELLLYPGLCIAAAALAFSLFGEALRDILEQGEVR